MSTADREIVASRVFDAPRALVFRMWTDPWHIARWWGPKGFTTTIHEMDFRPGGVWRFVMHGPDGRDYLNKIVYREIVRPERIAYSHVSGPLFDSTVTFTEEAKNRTRVDVRMVFESAVIRDRVAKEYGAIEGLHEHLESLGEELTLVKANGTLDDPFIISRTFDAPRDLMWKVWTDPAHLNQWFGPKGATIRHASHDFRPGGLYHYNMRTADGLELWGKWVFREIVPPERIVWVNSFSDEKGGITRHPMTPGWPAEMLTVITFTEIDGKTNVRVEWTVINATEDEKKVFDSKRDSMTAGWTGTFEQLEAYIGKVRSH